ncbi:MAG: TonB-dependent receptor, partial [Tunicatimonas sp.]
MKRLFLFFPLLITLGVRAQTTLTGRVQDPGGEAVIGANIYLKDTYDGASSTVDGSFAFVTSATGAQYLVVSAVGYRSHEQVLTVQQDTIRTIIVLREAINKMDGVTITAGAFAASDEKQGLMLKPLEIVTTAGALGDINGALATLPGTQTVAEDGRLFVRGGDGHETQTYMDGMLIHAPYGASAPELPTRGRFSPFLFKGTTFSTGGYSAEYGQALSSALILNSVDLAPQTQTDVSLMTVGVDATHQHRWENTSLLVRGEYTNLAPYQGLVKQDIDWKQAPVSGGGSVALRHKTSAQGMVKLYGYANRGQLALRRPTISGDDSDNIRVQNDNLYLNGTYQEAFTDRWSLRTGVSYTQNQTATTVNSQLFGESSTGVHTKATVTYDASEYLAIRGGGEHQFDQGARRYQLAEGEVVQAWDDQLTAGFIEADVYASSRWVARAGVRGEHSSLSQAAHLTPRLSLAYQTGSASQVSLAYGSFTQRPASSMFTSGLRLMPERATHYIANYQRTKNGRTFRAEAFQKSYRDLVKTVDRQVVNRGYGYARGVELFWRDRSSIKNADYWVSYSLLDTQRDYRDFPTLAPPTFAARHTFSVVYKHFVPGIKTQLGARYSFASGRPYFNPNHDNFHGDRTRSFNNLSLNAAYLIRQHIILYASATNVLGAPN